MAFLSPTNQPTIFNDMVGDLVLMPSSLGTYIQKPDGREYVRTGSAKAVTSAYQEASKHPTSKVIGTVSTSASTVVVGTVRDMAIGAAGQVAIVTSDSTNYFYSTDYGATWVAAAHGFVSFPPHTIAYDALVGGWVLAGASTTTLEVRTTPTLGTTTIQRVSVGLTIAASDAVVVRSTGGRFVLVTGSTSGGSYYSTTLATWNLATTSAAIGANPIRMVVGSGRVVVFNNALSVSYSNDGGVNWIAGTSTPLTCSNGVYNTADGNYYYQQGTTSTVYKSSTGYSGYIAMTWPTIIASSGNPSGVSNCMQVINGEVLIALVNGTIARTKDFIEYASTQTANAVNVGIPSMLTIDSNYNIVQVMTSTPAVCYGNFNTCTYVGHLYHTRSDNSSGVNNFTAYVRIK